MWGTHGTRQTNAQEAVTAAPPRVGKQTRKTLAWADQQGKAIQLGFVGEMTATQEGMNKLCRMYVEWVYTQQHKTTDVC